MDIDHCKNFDSQCGGVYINDTNTRTGSWSSITALTSTTFTTLTGNVSGLSGATLAAGITVYGQFSAIKLAGGTCVAYNTRPA